MMVTCVCRVDAGGRNTHARETKLHPKRTGDGVTVLRADDVDKGVRRASGLSRCDGEAAECQDEKEFDPTANRKKHSADPPGGCHAHKADSGERNFHSGRSRGNGHLSPFFCLLSARLSRRILPLQKAYCRCG